MSKCEIITKHPQKYFFFMNFRNFFDGRKEFCYLFSFGA